MNSSLEIFGSEERKSKREIRVQRVRDKVDGLILEYLPTFSTELTDQDEYYRNLPQLLKRVEAEFSSMIDFRDARNYLAHFINQGNEKKKWSLDVPPYITRMRREKPLRTKKWFTNVCLLRSWHQSWLEEITSNSSSTYATARSNNLLADVLLSALFHGAMCRPADITALANTLLKNSKPLVKNAEIVWLELMEENQSTSFRRWYPDAFSLACLHRYLLNRVEQPQAFSTAECWRLISKRLYSITKSKIDFSFSSFCKSAIGVTERLPGLDIPQVLVEYSIGNIESSSLTQQQMKLLFKTEFNESSVLKLSPFKSVSSVRTMPRAMQIDNELDFSHLLKSVRNALSSNRKPGVKNTTNNAFKDLQTISLSENYPFFVQVLLDWLMSLLTRDLAVSSVRRYFDELSKSWLLNARNIDFASMDPIELEDLYGSLLDHELNPQQLAYRAARIRQIHEYCINEYDFPELCESVIDDFGRAKSNVRVGYVSESLFAALCKKVQQTDDQDVETINGIICFLIICYRAGLRRSEGLKLRLCDIEASKDMWVFVRQNRYGDNKTSNALRKIPLSILLTNEERQCVSEYLRSRRAELSGHDRHLLFSLPHSSSVPLDPNQMTLLANSILRSLTGTDLTLNHLRHSAFCKLQAVIEKDASLIQAITPYSPAQAEKVRKALVCSDDETMHKNAYYAISGTAGHGSPAITFHHYLHFTDWVLGTRVSASTQLISAPEFKRLSEISTQTIGRECETKKLNTYEFEVKAMRPLLLDKLSKFTEAVSEVSDAAIAINNETEVNKTQERPAATIKVCYSILKNYEEGASIEDLVFQYNLPEVTIERFVESANAMSRLKTTKGKPRMFSKDRVAKEGALLLAPSQPIWNIEKIEIESAVKQMRSLLKSHREDFSWCLEYFLTHNNMSNTGLRFKKPSDLKRFMGVFLRVFKASRWQIHFSPQACDPSSEKSEALWRSVSPRSVFVVSKNTVNNLNLYPNGKSELFLLHPQAQELSRSREKQSVKKYSASNLRYILHMIAIMLFTKDQIAALDTRKEL